MYTINPNLTDCTSYYISSIKNKLMFVNCPLNTSGIIDLKSEDSSIKVRKKKISNGLQDLNNKNDAENNMSPYTIITIVVISIIILTLLLIALAYYVRRLILIKQQYLHIYIPRQLYGQNSRDSKKQFKDEQITVSENHYEEIVEIDHTYEELDVEVFIYIFITKINFLGLTIISCYLQNIEMTNDLYQNIKSNETS